MKLSLILQKFCNERPRRVEPRSPWTGRARRRGHGARRSRQLGGEAAERGRRGDGGAVDEDAQPGADGVVRAVNVPHEGEEAAVVVTGEGIEGEGTGPLLLTPSRDLRGDHPPVVPTQLLGQEAMEETRRRDHPGDQPKARGAKDPSKAGARASSE